MCTWALRWCITQIKAGWASRNMAATNHCVAAICWCLYSNNGSTDDYTDDYIDDSALEFKWIFGPTLKLWYSIEYLVPHLNLNARMNIWSHIETLILEWIFGTTFKHWYSLEYLVTPWNLHTRMNIWSHLKTFILEWMICMDIWWYLCKCNAGPGEMLLMQPRLRSSTKHSCYFFVRIDIVRQSTCWAVKLTLLLAIAWKG